MLHFYQILHFSSNLLSPESGRFTFYAQRSDSTPGPVSSIISQFSQQIESGISCFDQKMIFHQPPGSLRHHYLSAILNLFQHKRQKTLVLIYPFSVSTGLGGAGWGGIYPCSVSSLRSSVWPQVPGTTLEWKNPRFLEFYDRLVSIT